MLFTVLIPALRAIGLDYSWAIIPMLLAVQPPVLPAAWPNLGWAIIAMEPAVFISQLY